MSVQSTSTTETPTQREQDLEMLCIWASKLVGNKGAFETACEKWHQSYQKMLPNK